MANDDRGILPNGQGASEAQWCNGDQRWNCALRPALLASLYKTIGEVFPSLYVSDVAGSFNSVIYATNQKTSIQDLMANYQVLNADPSTPDFLLQILAETYAGMQPAPTGGVIFTDDKAPIEQLTNSMVLNFLLSGQVEKLQ